MKTRSEKTQDAARAACEARGVEVADLRRGAERHDVDSEGARGRCGEARGGSEARGTEARILRRSCAERCGGCGVVQR